MIIRFDKFGKLGKTTIAVPLGGIVVFVSNNNGSGKSTLLQTIYNALFLAQAKQKQGVQAGELKAHNALQEIKRLPFEISQFEIFDHESNMIISINKKEKDFKVKVGNIPVGIINNNIRNWDNGTILIQKNPENDLHPWQQTCYADLVVYKMMNSKEKGKFVNLFMSTNSPYILCHLDKAKTVRRNMRFLSFYRDRIENVSYDLDPIFENLGDALFK